MTDVSSSRIAPAALDGHCLAIGISQYKRVSLLPEVQDAQDLTQVLTDRSLCAFPREQVELLLDADATKPGILLALERLSTRTRDTSSVLVYFSGHGGRSTDTSTSDCYLMPVEGSWTTSALLERTAIAGRELSERLRQIRAARITIVLDCCRAAGLAEAKGAESVLEAQLSSSALSQLARGRGRAVLAASTSDSEAYARHGERNSVFTRHLLAGLRGAANGTGGVIRICDLYHYVQQQVCADQPMQRPMFKAELEENYPVALFHGGTPPPLSLPPVDDSRYDAFVSYRRTDRDRAWVEGKLVPALEALGLRLCLAHRDFRLGASRIREMERAVEQSRYTLAVLTPDYLAGAFEEFQSLIAQHAGLEQRAPRLIPLLREPCTPPLGVRMTELLDVSEGAFEHASVQRLAQRLREPHAS